MPPKQRGHNARGKKKIFRHAVNNVSLGVGHTSIGSVSLQLAAGTDSSTDRRASSAFLIELNHQLLSHSSKDYTSFRREVLELCETKEILMLHHRQVVEALLARLMNRSSGIYTGHSSVASARGHTVRGTTSEAYEAFLRLTVALARDLQAKFLPYVEVFQQAVQMGLYDKNGNVIADAERLQLLYGVQAAWCRELDALWEDDAHHVVVQRIIRAYVGHLRDSKEYIRRLTAELLAFICRRCRNKILPLVVLEACREVWLEYSSTDDGAEHTGSTHGSDAEDSGDDEASHSEDDDESAAAVTTQSERFTAFLQETLPIHPIVDGLSFFAADLFRGMHGTLNSSLEYFYSFLLQLFGISNETLADDALAVLESDLQIQPAAREHLCSIVHEVASLSLSQSMSMVLSEIRKTASQQSLLDSDAPSDDRPSHRLLSVVVQCFQPTVHHLHILDSLLRASNFFLWRDPRECELLRGVSVQLTAAAKLLSSERAEKCERWEDATSFCGAVLKMILPLCVSPYVTGEFDFGGRGTAQVETKHTLLVQQVFLSLGMVTTGFLSKLAYLSQESVSEELSEAAQVTLLAFVQDVLSKNFCFSLAKERQMQEDHDQGEALGPGAVPSHLTPFGLTLLKDITGSCWDGATGVLKALGSATTSRFSTVFYHRYLQRAVLLMRAASDHTLHTRISPLIQLTRLQSVATPKKGKTGASFLSVLTAFLLSLGEWFAAIAAKKHAQPSSTAAVTASQIFVCVLPVSTDIFDICRDEATLRSWLRVLAALQDSVPMDGLWSTNSLIQSNLALSMLRLSNGKDSSFEQPNRASKYLTEMIHHIAKSFAASAVRSTDFSMENIPGGAERLQLFRAAETTLAALEELLRSSEDATATSHSSGGKSKKTHSLKELLSAEAQRDLTAILLESLVAPMQSLRVAALRLLQAMCHPTHVTAEQRLEGLEAVDGFIFRALLDAECYNPLSHSGNMDGLRGALNPIVSIAERDGVPSSLAKLIIGRSMVGLLFLKFAAAWPIAQQILASLCKDSEGIIWTGAISPYARVMTIGDAAAAAPSKVAGEKEERDEEEGNTNQEQHLNESLRERRLYAIRLTDQQRHERGDMISRAFSSTQFRASRYTTIDLPKDDLEVLNWEKHWCQEQLSSSNVTHYANATDSATVSVSFLTALAAIAKQSVSKLTDSRMVVMEGLLFEISAIYRGDHPCGTSTLRRLEDRVEAALQMCSACPSIVVSSARDQRSLSDSDLEVLRIRSSRLTDLSSSFLADSNAKLQRAAIDSLKRLKVNPFSSLYALLVPYANNMKVLSTFLTTFHIDEQITVEDRPSYVSAVLTITLPKLASKVSKEKRKDQAVLQRRLLGFLHYLPSSKSDGRAALQMIVSELLNRVVFAKSQRSLVTADAFDFIGEWERKIQASQRQCDRYLEQLHKRLLSSLSLLEPLIGAVEAHFEDCVASVFTLALQSYIVACKECIQEPMLRFGTDGISRLLHRKGWSSLMSHVRRAAVTIVALLMEQYPFEVYECLENQSGAMKPLFSRYVKLLFLHARGSTRDADRTASSRSSAAKSYTTPMLRLLRAWLVAPPLLSLVPAFSHEVVGTIQEVLAVSDSSAEDPEREASSSNSPRAVHKAQTKDIYEVLTCVTNMVEFSGSAIVPFLGSEREGKKQTGMTLRSAFLLPSLSVIFEALYQLIARGAEKTKSEESTGGRSSSSKSFVSFSPPLWREMIHTVIALMKMAASAAEDGTSTLEGSRLEGMQNQLLEIAVQFVRHPVCIADEKMVILALQELEDLVQSLPQLDIARHYDPIVRLFNAVPSPQARLALCRIHHIAVRKIPFKCPSASVQMEAVSRAVDALNSFDDNNKSLDRYDFDLRYHAFNSLRTFFINDGNYGALTRHAAASTEGRESGQKRSAVRTEREYPPVTIPLPKDCRVLCVEGVSVLALNTMFYLRDSERTVRSFARHLLDALLHYAAQHRKTHSDEEADPYAHALVEMVRRHILPSLRQGVVAKDAAIRGEHMSAFAPLGKLFPDLFPTFAALYSPNSEDNFFLNVNHAQPKCRLNALAILRKKAANLLTRDLLRSIIPFLMTAVKSFAYGKRDYEDLSEERAKGYCEAVLQTLAAISQHLPWVAYYRVLSLLLESAASNADLRLPMLRGVVQVLDHFRHLDGEREEEEEEEDDDDDDEDEEKINAARSRRRRMFSSARVVDALERDLLPKLLDFIIDKKTQRGVVQESLPGRHSISAIRRDQEKKDKALMKNAIIQLPVAIAVTKIVKKLPEDRCNEYLDLLLDEVIVKLRTKNDKQRESARRILGVMLQETGPGKLSYVIKKLQGHLVHGYQLHVLGYSLVTLLHQLYEPNNLLLQERRASSLQASLTPLKKSDEEADQLIQKALQLVSRKGKKKNSDDGDQEDEEADALIDSAEDQLVQQLLPVSAKFDPAFGVACLDAVLEDLLQIFLDDYLGEIGHQKEQVELMSKMVEVKKNRATQGFSLLARHATASKMMTTFMQHVTWVLTPPAESKTSVLSKMSSSAGPLKALVAADLHSKYTTVGKTAAADATFVQKVRNLALTVAQNFLVNPTLKVDESLEQVHAVLEKHNEVREERIAAFEAKDGTRRIRGGHASGSSVERLTQKDLQEKNFMILPNPERVDADFSAPTVLATQQKQKLKAYKGRYAKDLKRAAKDFYYEDSTTAVVLDSLDEFLLRILLSMLRKVLGIGRDRKKRSVVELDLLRSRKRRRSDDGESEDEDEDEDDGNEDESENEEDDENDEESENEEDEDDSKKPSPINAREMDEMEEFAAAQAKGSTASGDGNLNTAFTAQHRPLLQRLLQAVLTTLEGEGSDHVVAYALDSVMALISLRPALDVGKEGMKLLDTVMVYLDRGGAIKQRALRVAAGIVAHHQFELPTDNAKELLGMIRGEMLERSEHLPMALSLLYSILGKHVQLAEVYDMIDLLTELLVHLSGKRYVRSRCILNIVRFLTEYRLTPNKFRSHIDLFCRNLNFPELGGRLALLELLSALIVRLPTVVVREESTVLLLPLATLTSQGELPMDRQKAGEVIQMLTKFAGIDALAPQLLEWMGEGVQRPVRTMAVQTVALCMESLRTTYGDAADNDGSEGDGFEGSVSWCIPALLEACRFVAPGAEAGASKKKAETARLKGWSLVFYALRALESILLAAPRRLYPTVAPELIPLLAGTLISHPHAWNRHASVRILNHYLYEHVEAASKYFEESDVLSTDGDGDATAGMPYMYAPRCGRQLLHSLSVLLRRLITNVAESDIANEKHDANSAIDKNTRTELLKLMMYVVKAAQQCGVRLLKEENSVASAKDCVHHEFNRIHRHIEGVAAPVLKHHSVTNYVVRSATLAQFFSGYVGNLPRGDDTAARYLVNDGAKVLSLMSSTAIPLIKLASHAAVQSQRLASIGAHALRTIQEELESRRSLFVTPVAVEATTTRKRQRDDAPALDALMASLIEEEAMTHQTRKVKTIKADVLKMKRRNRREG